MSDLNQQSNLKKNGVIGFPIGGRTKNIRKSNLLSFFLFFFNRTICSLTLSNYLCQKIISLENPLAWISRSCTQFLLEDVHLSTRRNECRFQIIGLAYSISIEITGSETIRFVFCENIWKTESIKKNIWQKLLWMTWSKGFRENLMTL